MSDELKGILIATLFACLLWELDERDHKKKKDKPKKKHSWIKKKK